MPIGTAKVGKAARGRARSSPLTPAQLRQRADARVRARELDGIALLARMAPNDGYLSWQSSPHVMWLAAVLDGESF